MYAGFIKKDLQLFLSEIDTTISVGRNLNLAPNETSCDSWFAIID